MSTFARSLLDNFENDWYEVNILYNSADAMLQTVDSTDLANAMCRAAIVLSVANLEAFLNDTAKAIIYDINRSSCFKDIPTKMKYTFCSSFLGESEKNDNLEALSLFFDDLNVKLDVKCFIKQNKNPKIRIIDSIFESMCGLKFFNHVFYCELEDVFKNDKFYIEQILEKLSKIATNATSTFPYKFDFSGNEKLFNYSGSVPKSRKNSLWNDFIDDVLKSRHEVAHGVIRSNPKTPTEIRDIIDKIKILEYAFFIILCHKICINMPIDKK